MGGLRVSQDPRCGLRTRRGADVAWIAIAAVAAVVLPGLAAGAAGGGRATRVVSAAAAGTGTAAGRSIWGRPTASGRLVSFESAAADLAANDANGANDVFLRDVRSGTTTLVSVNAAGTGTGNGESRTGEIGATGRFVAFSSQATDLVPGDANGQTDAFLRDVRRGTTTLVSVNAAGTGGGNGTSVSCGVSANGRFVAFLSRANDLVANDGNDTWDVFVRDVHRGTTVLVSARGDGGGTGNGASDAAAMDAAGRTVVFHSDATDLTGDETNSVTQVFVRDLLRGTTKLVSRNLAGTSGANGPCLFPAITANGRAVTFTGLASDLAPNDSDVGGDVFLRDLGRGTTTLVSARADGDAGGDGLSANGWPSANGRFVAYRSESTNLVSGNVDGIRNVFVRDVRRRRTVLVSVNAERTGGGNDVSGNPAVSASGRLVVFTSAANDLVADDLNDVEDVFLRIWR